MTRNTIPQIFFLIFLFLLPNDTKSQEPNWKPALDGNKIILIRHALAPGNGDPEGFKINDCRTQRNLNELGINQSKKIGVLLKKNNIKIDEVLSSEWCRCKDTARYAFKNFKVFPALNFTFSSPYDRNEKKQIKELKNFIKKWDGKGGNLVLVTHYVIILAVTDIAPSSGELVIIDKNFKVLSTINTF